MAVNRSWDDPEPATVGFRPLYRQIKDVLIGRIAAGAWRAGEAIPSEFEIAAELGASQGTVRKALDEMTAERLVVRRQGRGTYVARHDDARILFQFFKLVPDEGDRQFPDSRVLSIVVDSGEREETDRLALARGSRVVRLVRERSISGKVVILERIVLSASPFEPLSEGEVPNNLYDLYATRFGVTVGGGTERLKAVAAEDEEARSLGVETGAPLLLVDRVATDLSGRPVEWRRSVCRTDEVHYLSELN